ncbi:MAG: protein kinase [Bdellovibrionota bacterium]
MADSSHNSLQPGTLIAGRYTVVDQLGKGGIGEVYRVTDQELNGQVIALKVLRAALAADESTFQRFRNEVFVARALVHPNIVRIFDIGKAPEGYSFITMELVEGTALKTLLDEGTLYVGGSNQTVRQGRVAGFDQLVELYEQLLEGVAYAHGQGVIHRDLKPANILLGKNGSVKLLDFGTARFVESDLNLTQSGQLVGTPLYMAPEQIRGEKLDARCDVYALGLIGYEIATGKRPFPAEDVMSAMYHHLQQNIPRFAEPTSGIPAWYETIIFKACSKNREERFANAGDLLQAVRQKRLPTPESRRRRGPLAAVGAVVGVAVAVAFLMLRRDVQNTPPVVLDQSQRIESPAMDIPDELLEEQAKLERSVPVSESSSTEGGTTVPNAFPTPTDSATPMAPSVPQVLSTNVLSVTPLPTVTVSTPSPIPSAALVAEESPVPSAVPSIVATPLPSPVRSPGSAQSEKPVTVADILLRDPSSTVPSVEFDTESIPGLRALAIISGASTLGRSPQQLATALKLTLFRVGKVEPIRSFPMRILAEPGPGRDELRVGANFHDFSGVSLSPGDYRAEISLDGKTLGELHFSVR